MPEHSEQDLVEFYRQSRRWDPARHQVTLAAGSHNPFKVMTFNLLAQGHIKRFLFPYCAKETLKWPYRRVHLIAELKAYQADICCFQVQEMDHYEKFFKGAIEGLGYRTLFISKNPGNAQSDGLCLAWNPARFTLLTTETHSFASVMRHLPEATPNIAIFARFKDEQSGRRLVLACTHLYWHWDHDGLRAVQMKSLFEALLKWLRQHHGDEDEGEEEILVCGDFNSDPTSVAYRLASRRPLPRPHYDTVMKNAGLDAAELDQMYNWFEEDGGRCPPFRSAYACQTVRPDGVFGAYGELPWSTFNTFRGTTKMERSRLVVTQLLMPPADELVRAETALPNHHYSSDHMALVAQFAYLDRPYTRRQ